MSTVFGLLRNISILMDDVAVNAKASLYATSGILGDDLAVSAKKASNFSASRELPVVLAITKGSIINKIIIVPIMIALSYFLPFVIPYILICGGLFLAYEMIHGIFDLFGNHSEEDENIKKLETTQEDAKIIEKNKIKSAIVVDFVLSIEIVLIALSTVLKEPLINQILIVSFVALATTVLVYGLVALIIRMDDMGFWLIKKSQKKLVYEKYSYKIESNQNITEKEVKVVVNSNLLNFIGKILVSSMGKIISLLSYIGVVAMGLVSADILIHNVVFIHHFTETLPNLFNEWFIKYPFNLLIALFIGFFIHYFIESLKKLFKIS